MIDVELVNDDLIFQDTVVYKAVNLVNTQIGALYYAQDFGVDLDNFFNPDVNIQTETFKAYLIDRLTVNNISVISSSETGLKLETLLDFIVRDNTNTGMVANV